MHRTVRHLAETIGLELTAYIARRRHTDCTQAWNNGKGPYAYVEVRLRLAFRREPSAVARVFVADG